LDDQLDVLGICCKESEPIEHLNPHEEHAPGTDVKDEVVREIRLFDDQVDQEHHQEHIIQGD